MHFDDDNIPSNPSANPHLNDLIEKAISRRAILKSGLGLAALPFLGGLAACGSGGDEVLASAASVTEAARPSLVPLGFEPVAASTADEIVVPKGYVAEVIYRWGDPISASAPDFRGDASEGPAEQELQAGDNHDGMTFFPLRNADGSESSDRGLLAINHEYINPEYFFAPGSDPADWLAPWTADKAKKAQAGHGVSIVEVRRGANRKWEYVRGSQYNRRITGYTPMELSGPAAGADLLKTSADPSGTEVLGTLNNCANGFTPWGTYLTCEENFNGYFGTTTAGDTRTALMKRYGVSAGASGYRWEVFEDRFDYKKEPNESNRFGWVVEIDPFDPASKPVKRTALGRIKHENAELVLAADGTVVVYMGDDQTNEYIYKFVSDGKYDRNASKARNGALLDAGTLYVGIFANGAQAGDFKGVGTWVKLAPDTPALGGGTLADKGFATMADILVNTRGAADLVGATKMDRPEWVTANPTKAGEVYCTLTNNSGRAAAATDDANPRATNRWGQIVRWNEAGGDPKATSFTWDLFLLAGNPQAFPTRTDLRSGSGNVTVDNMFNSPDGLGFDRLGYLWIQTDGNFSNAGDFAGMGNNQMLMADPKTGLVKRFLVGPAGCEVTGLTFTPDMTAMFINIQHPGEIGSHPNAPKLADGKVYGDNDIARDPTAFSRWPDGKDAKRPRAATVVVRRLDGAKVGT